MTARRLLAVVLTSAMASVGAYIAMNIEWEDVPIPTPPKGEAVSNPFYAAQRFAEALGSRTRRERSLVLPSPESVVVLSVWHWDLSRQRQTAIMEWVESGGRLVVDDLLTGELESFAKWSGLTYGFNQAAYDAHEDAEEHPAHERCVPVRQVVPESEVTFSVCELHDFSFLKSDRLVVWALRNTTGNQAVRVQVGKGSVTAINNAPFIGRALLEGDHARLFVAATQLRAADEIVFLSEDDHPPLLALLWRYGGPAVALFLAVVVLLLWRGALRFGPLAAVPPRRRRSMAEQIRGSGRFALEQGDGASLHAASVRALHEAARRKIPAYARLSRPQRAAALGRATGMDGAAIVAAIEGVSKRRAAELPATLGLLETARRQLLTPGA